MPKLVGIPTASNIFSQRYTQSWRSKEFTTLSVRILFKRSGCKSSWVIISATLVVSSSKRITASDHRALYQSIIKRSDYFIAYKAKFNRECEIGTQEELNVRFFEGASGGAVILGIPPQSETFKQNFDWSDAVIELSDNTTNVAEVIADLNAQPERLKEIRKNNIVNSLLRHDWVYRWGQILDKAGLSHTSKMAQRRDRLQTLADLALQKSR